MSVRVSRLTALMAVMAATPAAAQLPAQAQRAFNDYRNFSPQPGSTP